MARFAKKGSADFELISLARRIISRVPAKNRLKEVRAIQLWVRQNIRYTRDPYGIETVQQPEVTIEVGHGDCDDQAVVTATLLMAIGAKSKFVAIAFKPNRFCHVFTETHLGRGWFSVETTERVDLGWQPRGVVKKIVQHI